MSKKEEEPAREITSDKGPKSRARKIRIMLKKNKGIFKDKQAMTDFIEPVAMLIRRGKSVEFFEDASKGLFEYKHSDGGYRTIFLEPSTQLSFDYGSRKFRGYILDEDSPIPLPHVPTVTTESIGMIIEKVIMDMKRLNTKENEMKLKTIKTFIIMGLVIAGIFFIWKYNVIPNVLHSIGLWKDTGTAVASSAGNVADTANTLGVTATQGGGG